MPPRPPHDDRAAALGLALAAGAAILFGTSFVATAFALRSFSPLAVAVWRGVGASAFLAVVIAARGQAGLELVRRARPELRRLVALGVLGGPFLMAGMNLAVGAAGATIASFVAGLYAVLAAVFAPFLLGERLGRPAIAGFVVALAGTVLLADLGLASAAVLGILAALGGAVAYALYLVLSRRWAGGGLSGELVAFAIFAAAAILLTPVDLATDRRGLVPTAIDPIAVIALLWLVVGPSAVANLMIQASVRRIPARRTSAVLLLNPIAASLLAALLLGERLSPLQLVGGGLVLAGIALSTGAIPFPSRSEAVARGPTREAAAAPASHMRAGSARRRAGPPNRPRSRRRSRRRRSRRRSRRRRSPPQRSSPARPPPRLSLVPGRPPVRRAPRPGRDT